MRRYLDLVIVILQFRYYFPLEKNVAVCLNLVEFPSSKDALCQVWLKVAKLFWRRNENMKSLQTDGRQTIRKAHEHLAQVS